MVGERTLWDALTAASSEDELLVACAALLAAEPDRSAGSFAYLGRVLARQRDAMPRPFAPDMPLHGPSWLAAWKGGEISSARLQEALSQAESDAGLARHLKRLLPLRTVWPKFQRDPSVPSAVRGTLDVWAHDGKTESANRVLAAMPGAQDIAREIYATYPQIYNADPGLIHPVFGDAEGVWRRKSRMGPLVPFIRTLLAALGAMLFLGLLAKLVELVRGV